MSLILDVVVLVLLGLTIVYAARLSLQLKRLRDSRADMDRLVRDLVRNVDRAERAIAGLKEAARESGGDLQNAIDKATSIADELELITDSGDRLASRLEGLVEAGRPMAAGQQSIRPAAPKEKETPRAPAQDSNYAQHLRKLDMVEERAASRAAEDKAAKIGFAIRDPDAERGVDPVAQAAADETLYSEAERDLFRALKGRAR